MSKIMPIAGAENGKQTLVTVFSSSYIAEMRRHWSEWRMRKLQLPQ